MGKKKIDKITRIVNDSQRKVSLCKRKKGLIKKTIELSVLCDLKMFVFVLDESQNRVTHFASHQDLDIIDLFNNKYQREFFTNKDYELFGGNKDEFDSELCPDDGGAPNDDANLIRQNKIFSNKRKDLLITSKLGNLRSQQHTLPVNTKQEIVIKNDV